MRVVVGERWGGPDVLRVAERQAPRPVSELCPEIEPGMALMIERMMAKRPDERFQTALEVAHALTPFVTAPSPAGVR